jgi:hypothetical protein
VSQPPCSEMLYLGLSSVSLRDSRFRLAFEQQYQNPLVCLCTIKSMSLMIHPRGPLDLPLQGLQKISGPLRGKAACRRLSSVYSYASEKDARGMDLLSAMHRDIRPLSSIAPQKDLL